MVSNRMMDRLCDVYDSRCSDCADCWCCCEDCPSDGCANDCPCADDGEWGDE